MNKKEMLKELKSGKKMRVANWDKGCYIYFDDKELRIKDEENTYFDFPIPEESWEIYEEQKEDKDNLQINFKDYVVLEPSNCMGIVPRFKPVYDLIENEFELKLIGEENKFWKVISEDRIIPDIKGFGKDFESYKISQSRYSKEFIDKARKVSKAFGYGDKPEIFLCWDKEKEEYKENAPCLIIFDRVMVFILAPRVESD
jgi:hypothetical protein